MIEKDITTWEEFKTALTEGIAEKTTYNIKNDLDATNDILTENIICITGTQYSKIFKGNNYKINGITAYGDVTVFYLDNAQQYDNNFRFYDIQFTNFMVESGTFTALCRNNDIGDYEIYKDLFVNCFFNGVCQRFAARPVSKRLAYFKKCSINVRCTTFAGDGNTFDSCYIVVTPLQNTNAFGTLSVLINSYVDGVIQNTFSKNLTPQFNNNNVFNCKVIVTNYSDSNTYEVNTSDKPVLINKDRLLQSDGVTPIRSIKSATNVYLLTDKQMKDKNYIQQNTEFPLYG